MSIQVCQSFLLEQLLAIHDFSADTIKLALFDGTAGLDDETTAYSTTGEIATGGGYTAGGNALTLTSGYPQIEAKAGAVRFQETTWMFTLEKTIQQALLYNSSKANRAIIVLSLPSQLQHIGEFKIQFPLAANPIVFNRAPMPTG